jgi:hypothetical protein
MLIQRGINAACLKNCDVVCTVELRTEEEWSDLLNISIYPLHTNPKIFTENPKTNTLIENAPRIWLVLPKSLFTNGMAGAKIELANGLKNVIAEMRLRINHFLFCGKLRGFVESVCESQPTRLLSRSDTGYTSCSSFWFLVLFRVRCFSRSLPMESWAGCGCWKLLVEFLVWVMKLIGRRTVSRASSVFVAGGIAPFSPSTISYSELSFEGAFLSFETDIAPADGNLLYEIRLLRTLFIQTKSRASSAGVVTAPQISRLG